MIIKALLRRYRLLKEHQPLSVRNEFMYGRCRFTAKEQVIGKEYRIKKLADFTGMDVSEPVPRYVMGEDNSGRKHCFLLDSIDIGATLYRIRTSIVAGRSHDYAIWRAVSPEHILYFIKEK